MTNNPLISVLCASYNHEKYVGYFIKSLQNQTYSNWELIIVDDCSSDKNVEEIRRLAADEPRIHLFEQPFNQGPGAALNKAFSESKGEIVVDMASDDSLKNDYFEFVIKTFSEKADIGAIYSPLDVMDENNKIYENWPLDTSMDRITLLKKMFYGFNEVFSPGMALRREVYSKIIPMDVSMVQHQDYQWHIIFMLNTECLITEKAYVNYRFIKDNRLSLGSRTDAAATRFRLEIFRLMDTFLQIKDMQLLKQFTDSELCDKLPEECAVFILGMSALNCETLEKRQWGYNQICKAYADDNIRKILYDKIDFKFADFLALAKNNYYMTDSFFKRKIKGLKKRIKHIFAK